MEHEKKEHEGKKSMKHHGGHGKHGGHMGKKEMGFGAKLGKKRGDGLEGPHEGMKK